MNKFPNNNDLQSQHNFIGFVVAVVWAQKIDKD